MNDQEWYQWAELQHVKRDLEDFDRACGLFIFCVCWGIVLTYGLYQAWRIFG